MYLVAAIVNLAPSAVTAKTIRAHAFNPFVPVRYEPGYRSFDFVNPQAPKGGELRYATNRQVDTLKALPWDKRNPSVVPLRESANILLDSLMVQSLDGDGTYYGLVAESLEYPDDFKYVDFLIDPRARFQNGEHVTAADIEFSYRFQRESHPWYQHVFRNIADAKVIGPRRIRFEISASSKFEAEIAIYSLCEVSVLSEQYSRHHSPSFWGRDDFPMTSGPYRVEAFVPRERLVFRRDPHYWAADHPARRGYFNFDRVTVVANYFDESTRRIAFLKNELDVWTEDTVSQWTRFISSLRHGEKHEEIATPATAGFDGFILNSQRPHLRDRRVRQAIDLAFNFSPTNFILFSGALRPATSLFVETPFALTSSISEEEKALLEAFDDAVPVEAYGTPFRQSDGDSFNRKNLVKAARLLREAGLKIRDGVLVDQSNRPFELTYFYPDRSWEKWISLYTSDIRRLGIKLNARIMDKAAYMHMVVSRDWDMILTSMTFRPGPNPEELSAMFGSESVDQKLNTATVQVKNPVVDQLIEKLRKTSNLQERIVVSRALDRVVLAEHYFVPTGRVGAERVAYKSWIRHPEPLAPTGANALLTWWAESWPGGDEKLKSRQ